MIGFAALVLAAVLFKVQGNQFFTPMTVVVAAALLALRPQLLPPRRAQVDDFLLLWGVLIYALANQDPSYYEHAALLLCWAPTLDRLRNVGKTALAEGSILMVLLFILWSATWTSNMDMSVAGFVMSGLCLMFLVAYVLAHQGDLTIIFRHILTVLLAVMVGSWVVGAMGHGAAGRTFSGVTLHRNQLGFLLGLLILICLFALRSRWRWPYALAGVAAAGLLVYIDSKSAIISISFTSVLFWVVTARRWKLYLGLLMLGLAVFFTALPSPKMDNFALWMGRDPTFTSRTEIWADSLRLASDQPFTGYGYNAVWSAHENRLAQYRDAPGPQYAHAHNAWIDWVLQLGVGGLLVYLIFLGGLLQRAWVAARAGPASPQGLPMALQAVCLLVYIQLYDLANVSTVPVTRFGFFMLAVTTLCLWLATRGAEAGAASAWRSRSESPAANFPASAPRPSRGQQALVAGVLTVVGLLGMSAYAVWDDGRRYAAAEKRNAPAAASINEVSLIDARQFQWKTTEKLKEYASKHRQSLLDMMQRSEAP